uniref:Uncharacterized protein n=1 Tax=Trichogloeopsis pedicellata TaxID=1495610 RepID=A0A1G4P0H7_9FLOR|nr:Hypothetical protein ORF_5 [Trichogloeopsis pedicellata]SCW24397.1 Hypothetical protein ORF_5 [Trichogloeopsis pedicellata]
MVIFNQYLNLPASWLTRLSTRSKFIIISIYIILATFCSLRILIIQHILLIILWKLALEEYPIVYKRYYSTLLLIYFFYCICVITTPYCTSVSLQIPYSFQISIPLLSIWNYIVGYNSCIYCNVYNVYQYLYIYLPLLLTRSYLLFINYFSIYSFIIYTTSSEQIIINIVSILLGTRYQKTCKDSIIVITLSSEFISILHNKFRYTQTTLLLRGITQLQAMSSIFYLSKLIFVQYKKICMILVNNMLYSVYSKELLYYNIYFWLIT